MVAVKNMIQYADLPTRQKLFFYELCKSGVVVFNLNDPAHFEVLMVMIDRVKEKFDEGNYADESCLNQSKLINDRVLNALIVKQILRFAIKPN